MMPCLQLNCVKDNKTNFRVDPFNKSTLAGLGTGNFLSCATFEN